MWNKTFSISKTVSLKVALSPPHNYHLLPVLPIYPGEKFANLKDLLCGTPGLIFPHLVNGEFHSIQLTIIHCSGHWSPAQCCRRQASFWARQVKHPAMHCLGAGYLL